MENGFTLDPNRVVLWCGPERTFLLVLMVLLLLSKHSWSAKTHSGPTECRPIEATRASGEMVLALQSPTCSRTEVHSTPLQKSAVRNSETQIRAVRVKVLQQEEERSRRTSLYLFMRS